MWAWLSENAALVLAILPVLGAVGAVVQFVWIRQGEARKTTFETYHRLIKELVEGERPDATMFVDRQVAVVFELRRFRRYRDVSLRIFRGLRQTPTWAAHPRLAEEIDLAIADLERLRWWEIRSRICSS